MSSFLKESGKEHGTKLQNVLSIKFHYKSWAAFGCQMMLNSTTNPGQPLATK